MFAQAYWGVPANLTRQDRISVADFISLIIFCRLPETGMLLVEIGGVEGLARVAEDGHIQVSVAFCLPVHT